MAIWRHSDDGLPAERSIRDSMRQRQAVAADTGAAERVLL